MRRKCFVAWAVPTFTLALLTISSCAQQSAAQPSTPQQKIACNPANVQCALEETASVSPYKDGKLGAASFTFDDGASSDFHIADMLQRRGFRGSFYIIAGNVSAAEWPMWKALSNAGHEIGNHSMHHLDLANPSLTDSDLHEEIDGAQQVIAQQIGIKPLVFVFPYSALSTRALGIAYVNHVATRTPGYQYDTLYTTQGVESNTTLDELNASLQQTLKIGGWHVLAAHGIDGNAWQPIPSAELEAHLDYVKTLVGTLWVDTFYHVAQYRLCREHSYVGASYATTSSMKIRLESFAVPPLDCNIPLTVTVPAKSGLSQDSFLVTDASGVSVAFEYTGSEIRLEMKPTDEDSIMVLAR